MFCFFVSDKQSYVTDQETRNKNSRNLMLEPAEISVKSSRAGRQRGPVETSSKNDIPS